MDNLIRDALDLHVTSLEEERVPDGKWHPSQLWQCARMNILAVRGVIATSPPDAQAKRVFRMGHVFHSLVQDALPGHPGIKAVYPEFGIDVEEWNVVGHGDALIELDNGDWYVVEIKSTKSLRWTPKEDHLRQASVYFTAARDFGWAATDVGLPEEMLPLGDKLRGIILVYLDKSNLDIREYVYPYNPQWRKDIEDWIKWLDLFRLAGDHPNDPLNLPPALPLDKGKPNWYLRYCQFRGSGQCCADNPSGFEEDDEW